MSFTVRISKGTLCRVFGKRLQDTGYEKSKKLGSLFKTRKLSFQYCSSGNISRKWLSSKSKIQKLLYRLNGFGS